MTKNERNAKQDLAMAKALSKRAVKRLSLGDEGHPDEATMQALAAVDALAKAMNELELRIRAGEANIEIQS